MKKFLYLPDLASSLSKVHSVLNGNERYLELVNSKKDFYNKMLLVARYFRPSTNWPVDRLGLNNYIFNMKITNEYVEYQDYPEVINMSYADALIEAAKNLAATGKTIDVMWSGGLDSTAMLLALVEVCPKQLRVLLSGECEYPWIYEKLRNSIDIVVDTNFNINGSINPQDHVWTSGAHADNQWGCVFEQSEIPHPYGKGRVVNNPESKDQQTDWWNFSRRYLLDSLDFRFILDLKIDKINPYNCKSFFLQPVLEKWIINYYRNNEIVYFTMPAKRTDTNYTDNINLDVDYRKCKIPMRDAIYQFTGDRDYAYDHLKIASAKRGTDSRVKTLNIYKNLADTENKIFAVLEDGTIIRNKDINTINLEDYMQ